MVSHALKLRVLTWLFPKDMPDVGSDEYKHALRQKDAEIVLVESSFWDLFGLEKFLPYLALIALYFHLYLGVKGIISEYNIVISFAISMIITFSMFTGFRFYQLFGWEDLELSKMTIAKERERLEALREINNTKFKNELFARLDARTKSTILVSRVKPIIRESSDPDKTSYTQHFKEYLVQKFSRKIDPSDVSVVMLKSWNPSTFTKTLFFLFNPVHVLIICFCDRFSHAFLVGAGLGTIFFVLDKFYAKILDDQKLIWENSEHHMSMFRKKEHAANLQRGNQLVDKILDERRKAAQKSAPSSEKKGLESSSVPHEHAD